MQFNFLIIFGSLALLAIFLATFAITLKKSFREKKTLEEENNKLKLELGEARAKVFSYEAYLNDQTRLKNDFKALAEETLESTQAKWIEQAERHFQGIRTNVEHNLEKKELVFSHLVQPVKETLSKLEEKLVSLQKEKHAQDEVLKTQLEKMVQSEILLARETGALVNALKTPSVRGFWGEMTLKRVVELSGMINHCDFFEQYGVSEDDRLRPDLVIKLPGERHLVIDAKVPFESFLAAQSTENEQEKKAYLEKHAKALRLHIQQLSRKSYFEKFSLTPEFVIMFLPVDQLYLSALEYDPSMMEYSTVQGVIITTPMSLIGLLKSIAFAWKQEAMSINAKEISQQGEDLYKSIKTFLEHFDKLGKSMSNSVQHFNQMMGSFESRLLPKARRMQTLLGVQEELEDLKPVERVIKSLSVDS
jgi:DNA recombination protein RmuC